MPTTAPLTAPASPSASAWMQINGERLPGRRAQAAQHGDGAQLRLEVRVDRARHADAAEQQRDETDRFRKWFTSVNTRPSWRFAVGDGVGFELVRAQIFVVAWRDQLGTLDAGGQFQVGEVTHEAAAH